MEKIAQLFEVPVERLLDDYNLFLRNGQGKQIKAIRMKLGLDIFISVYITIFKKIIILIYTKNIICKIIEFFT